MDNALKRDTVYELEKMVEDLHNGDELKSGRLTREEYVKRITALRIAIAILRGG